MPRLDFYGIVSRNFRNRFMTALRASLVARPDLAKEIIVLFHEPDIRWLVSEEHRGENLDFVHITSGIKTIFPDAILLAKACIPLASVELTLPNGTEIYFPMGSPIPDIQHRYPGQPQLGVAITSLGPECDGVATTLARACVSSMTVELLRQNTGAYTFEKGWDLPVPPPVE